MGESYGVDSLHINVGDGECTVHLLVKVQPTTDAKSIEKAILIDTGSPGASRFGRGVLASSLASIAARYGCPVLQFDAVVLSVWDPDYYGGLFELLGAEVDDNVQPGQRLDNFRASWLKYDAQGNPVSVLYAPCAPPSHVPELKLLGDGTNRLIFEFLRPGADQPIHISGFCNFVYSPELLLGRDLFTASGPPVNFFNSPASSPYDLLARNPPGRDMPALYCIAADKTVMTSRGRIAKAESSLAFAIMWDSKPACVSYFGGSVADDAIQSELLDWITADPPATHVEGISVTTMKVGSRSGKPVTIADAVDSLAPQSLVMFTGSKYGNPRWELILLLHTLLLSQQSDVALSGTVYATQYPYYFVRQPDTAGSRSSYADFSGTGQLSYDAFVRPEKNDQFLAMLSEFYDRINQRQARLGQPGLVNIYDQYCMWGGDETKRQQPSEKASRDWITDQCERRWAQISPITSQSHPAVGAAVHGSFLDPVGVKGAIEYICVESRDAARGQVDGVVKVKYLGQADLQNHQKSRKIAALSESRTPSTLDTSRAQQHPETTESASNNPVPPGPGRLALPSTDHDQPLSHVDVVTLNGLYNLETLLEPPADALEVLAEANPRLTTPRKPLWVHPDPTMQARLGVSRQVKKLDATTTSAIANELCIASTFLDVEGGAVGKPSVLAPGDADSFVGSLHNARLDLASKPVVPAAGETPKFFELDKADELYGWFAASVGARKLQLASSAKNKIAEVELTQKLSFGGEMKFGTKHLAHNFGQDPLRGLSEEMGGLVSPQNLLVLGLDPGCDALPVRMSDVVPLPVMPDQAQNPEILELLAMPLSIDVRPGSRNAIFFDPERSYRTVERLQYTGNSQSAAIMTKFLGARIPGISVTGVKVVSKHISTWTVTGGATVPSSRSRVASIWTGFIKVDITFKQGNLLAQLLSWLATQVGQLDLAALLESETAKVILSKTPEPRRISITLPLAADGSLGEVSAVSVDIELLAKVGTLNDNNSILFLFTYAWSRVEGSSLRGALWLKPPLGKESDIRKLLPDWEEDLELVPLNRDHQGSYVDLRALVAPSTLPLKLPSRITEATIEIRSTGWAFGGAICGSPPTPKEDTTPQVYLGKLGVRVIHSWKSGAQFILARLDIDVGLLRKDVLKKDDKPGRIRGSVVYDGRKKRWLLGAVVKSFDLAYLYALFARETSEALTVLLRFVHVSYLVLAFENVDSVSKGFQMVGGINIGSGQFDLVYTCGPPPGGQATMAVNPFRSGPAKPEPMPETVDWEIAISTPGNKEARNTPTLKEVLAVFVGPVVLGLTLGLPAFLLHVKIGDIKVSVRSVRDAATKAPILCIVASLMVNGVEMTFIVMLDPTSGPKAHTKCVLKAALPKIPELDLQPMGKLKVPIDELFIAYVIDVPPKPFTTDVTKMVGLTVADLALANTALAQLKMKRLDYQRFKNERDMTDKDAAIVAGGHIFIMGVDENNKSRVAFDYPFATPKVAANVIRPKDDGASVDKKPQDDRAKDSGGKDNLFGPKLDGDSTKQPPAHAGDLDVPEPPSDDDEPAAAPKRGKQSPKTGRNRLRPPPRARDEDDEGSDPGPRRLVKVDKAKGIPVTSAPVLATPTPATTTAPTTTRPATTAPATTAPVTTAPTTASTKTDQQKPGSSGQAPSSTKAQSQSHQADKSDVFNPDDVSDSELKNRKRRDAIHPPSKTPKPPMQVMPFKKDTEYFLISNVGITYEDNTLTLYLDAKVILGVLHASVTGLWIAVTFDREKVKEDDPLLDKIKVSQETTFVLRPGQGNLEVRDVFGGMRNFPANYNENDLPGVAGLAMFNSANHDDVVHKNSARTIAGGLIFGVTKFRFTAALLYQSREHSEYKIQFYMKPATVAGEEPTRAKTLILDPKKNSTSSTVFFFLKWEGRIQFTGVALTGLMVAFGYNLQLRLPRVDEVKDFPLVAMHRAAPLENEMFLAFGAKLDFALVLSIDTAVIVQFSPEFRFTIVGVAVCELPSVQCPVKMARIEFGFIATLHPNAGSFKLEGALSPESYILHENCHLRGGLAVCFWWPVSGNGATPEAAARTQGDYVMTIGGYHKSFSVPGHYPSVDRLALEWRVSDAISMRGELYFARTPKAVMMGVMVALTFRAGNLSAWFTAWLDLLANLETERFSFTGGITVGVNYTIEAFWVSTNVSAQLGAQFHIEARPFGCRARVEFWVFTFDIEYGDTSRIPEYPKSLQQFYELVLGITGKNAQDRPATVSFNATAGLLAPAKAPSSDPTNDDKKKQKPWTVRGGLFVFSIGSTFPVSSVLVDDRSVPVSNETPLYAKPMKRSAETVSSEIHVRIFKKEFRGQNGTLDPGYDKIGWNVVPATKALPKGFWDKYEAWKDPAAGGNSSALNDGGPVSVNLTTDLALTPPPPRISADGLAPIKAGEQQKEDALDLADPRFFPKLEVANAAFTPAKMGTSAGHYEEAARAWQLPRPEAQDLLDFWATSLFWDNRPGGGTSPLDGSMPKMYIDKQDQLWMAAPSINAVA
ncbi:hypothetical protein TrVGV298_008174 [Trichoderma virens]|nr:hypothetical protein TrVGV298_008174 [Trichoderma virens]